MGFEKQLRLSAAYSGDRVRLHQLIMETASTPAVEEKSPEEEKHTSTEVATEEEALVTPETTDEKDRAETSMDPDEEFLNKQILSHAISHSDLLSEGKDSDEDEDGYAVPSHISYKRSDDWEEEEEFDGEEDTEEELELGVQPQKEDSAAETSEGETRSFSDWLHQLEDSEEADKEEEQEIVEEEKQKEHLLPERTRANFYNPTEMAKLSVKEDDDLITETLAKIYAQQGNIEKAIKSYRKLSLKYPEKKVYFASQIRQLEKGL